MSEKMTVQEIHASRAELEAAVQELQSTAIPYPELVRSNCHLASWGWKPGQGVRLRLTEALLDPDTAIALAAFINATTGKPESLAEACQIIRALAGLLHHHCSPGATVPKGWIEKAETFIDLHDPDGD